MKQFYRFLLFYFLYFNVEDCFTEIVANSHKILLPTKNQSSQLAGLTSHKSNDELEKDNGSNDIGSLLKPDITVEEELKKTAPFVLKAGNVSLDEFCQLNETFFEEFFRFYSDKCMASSKSSTVPSDIDSEIPKNGSSECTQSVDLPAKGAAEREHISSLAIFLILCVLGICIITIYFLLKTKLHYLPESVACVLIGAIIGLILKILHSKNIANWEKEEAFSPTIFFLVFLPPIIFESGYNLHKGNFFQNIGSILTFAVLGTLLSSLVIGGGVFILGQADVVYKFTFVESFAFGSLISAVDPVATLAIFNALNIDQVLYMLVFGESILNDAISIVLTNSVIEIASPAMSSLGPSEAIAYTLWRFCMMFFASAFIGVCFGLMSALALKYIPVREFASLELCVVLIFIYAPYALAEGIHLSGIMAILFNGIVMSHYTHFNLSPIMQITIQHLMRTLALIAECTVFIYLGLGIFSFQHKVHPALIIWSIVLCLVGRAVNIYPLSWFVNKFRDHKITSKMMFVMWFSGLRGAIAYALSLHLEFNDEKRHVIVTTTLIIVLFTIFCLGGATLPLIKFVKAEKKMRKQKLRTKRELTLSKTRELGQALDSEYMSEMTEEESDVAVRSNSINQNLRGFMKFDQTYLRPLLIRKVTPQEVHSHASNLKNQCYQSLLIRASESEEDQLFPSTN